MLVIQELKSNIKTYFVHSTYFVGFLQLPYLVSNNTITKQALNWTTEEHSIKVLKEKGKKGNMFNSVFWQKLLLGRNILLSVP